MMQRMVMTLPNWLSFQSWKVLSNMAMPVALSARGYGFWPKTTTFHLCSGLGLSAWKVSSRMGTTSGLRPGPMNVAAAELRLDDRLQERQPRLATALEEFGEGQRVTRVGRGGGVDVAHREFLDRGVVPVTAQVIEVGELCRAKIQNAMSENRKAHPFQRVGFPVVSAGSP
ncbi:hypothetical protein ACFQX6_40575 [Streptosporangium lutulentum]